MKKLLVPLMILFISLFTGLCYGEEVDLKKVNSYIKDMETIIDKYPKIGEQDKERFEECKIIVDRYNLNDGEYLEVLNILTKDQDILEIMNKWQTKEVPFDQNIWNKNLVFFGAAGFLTQKWQRNIPSLEAVLTQKILPIISSTKNAIVVRYWIINSGDILRDITNKKLPLSENNRNKFCDKLIEIIVKEENPENLRARAIETWSIGEKRSNKWIENVDGIIRNKNLFKSTAIYFYRGPRTPQEVINKMFNILEHSDKYQQEIVDGALEFLGRASGSDDEVLVSRLKKVLNEKLAKNKNDKNQGKYDNIIQNIEWHEKRKNK